MGVEEAFLSFGGLLATRETETATIDDFPFRLQYKVATAVAFLASGLLSVTELVGSNLCKKLKMIKKFI